MIWRYVLVQHEDSARDPRVLAKKLWEDGSGLFGGHSPYLIDDYYVEDGRAYAVIFFSDTHDSADVHDLLTHDLWNQMTVEEIPEPALPDGLESIQYDSFHFVWRMYLQRPTDEARSLVEQFQMMLFREAIKNQETLLGEAVGLATWSAIDLEDSDE